jgi:DNA polymerase III subunit gamma/tau
LEREQIANRRQTVTEECEPLEEKKLQELWKQYTAQLVQNKSSAVQSFELATLEIKDENNFEAISNNSLEQKFIEQEKRVVCEFLQKGFNNKKLSFIVSIRENNSTAETHPQTFSKRDQYLKIVEQYPLVGELKDRLKLELDY